MRSSARAQAGDLRSASRRSAASAASATSITSRASTSSSTSSRSSGAGARDPVLPAPGRRAGSAVTNVPRPARVSTSPALTSMLIASRTEPTLTEYCGRELPVAG